MLLEILSQVVHRSHIGEQDRFDYPLLDNTSFSWFEMAAQEVIVGILKQLQRLGSMVVLLDLSLTKHLVKHGFGDHVVPVVEAIMLDIVAESGNEERKSVQTVELGILNHVLRLQDNVAMLRNVGAVQIVVIGYISIVLVVDLGKELQELAIIYELEQIVLF